MSLVPEFFKAHGRIIQRSHISEFDPQPGGGYSTIVIAGRIITVEAVFDVNAHGELVWNQSTNVVKV